MKQLRNATPLEFEKVVSRLVDSSVRSPEANLLVAVMREAFFQRDRKFFVSETFRGYCSLLGINPKIVLEYFDKGTSHQTREEAKQIVTAYELGDGERKAAEMARKILNGGINE